MNTKYDKPFKTFDELALYLEMHHGLTVKNGNVERKYISDMLRIIPYYDVVNGYKDCFMSEDRFLPGIRFSDLQTFYSFDRGFQMRLKSIAWASVKRHWHNGFPRN